MWFKNNNLTIMLKNLLLLLLLIPLTSRAQPGRTQRKDYRINQYGAVADGETNNALVIQKLIDKVSASGGGRIIVPPGNFITGTLFLKSGIDLHVEKGGRLLGSPNRKHYDNKPVTDKKSPTDPVELNDRVALISARNQTNIGISGQGVIDGQGQELMLDIFNKLRNGEMKQDSAWIVKRPGQGRAFLINIVGCKQVTVKDITLKNCSEWVQDYRECDNVLIDHITVQSTTYWNNDGLDITDSKNVIVRNCYINSSDDSICLKSENPAGACENITIENCTVRSSANGLKFGTASHGGFRHIKVRNLTVLDTYRSAIALESVDGGTLEDVDIQHVTAKKTGNAIFIKLGHRNTNGKVGVLRKVYIAHVNVETPLHKPDQGYPIEGPPDHLSPGVDKMPKRPSSYHIYGHPWLPYNLIPSSITGVPGHPVQDIVLEDITLTYGGRANKAIAHIPPDKITTVPENVDRYPDFSMFGELPAWGLYMRHAEGIQFKNVQIKYLEEDFRPALVFDDVKNITLSDVRIPTAKEMPVLLLNNAVDVKTSNLKLPANETNAIQRSNYP